MSEVSFLAGYFGKVHTHGDFVTKGLSNEFTETWHHWLQQMIVVGRSQLGKNWINYYLTAPLYRFLLLPGLSGKNAWLGVLMPSVDRIGRYYPLTVAVAVERPDDDRYCGLFELEKAWFESVELLMLGCLSDDFDLNVFNRNLSHIELEYSICTQSPRSPASRKPSTLPLALWYSVDSCSTLSRAKELPEEDAVGSYWWTRGSETVCQSFLVCSGLPEASLTPAMLDGNWQQWGWELQV